MGGQGFLLVYDITNEQTFKKTLRLYDQIINSKDDEKTPIVLAGNKVDLRSEKGVISKEQGQEQADVWNTPFLETSAKENLRIEECFTEVARLIKKRRQEELIAEQKN